ncbi:type VI secretion system baseplate subunit TssF [Noviherbaspirillum denitrificans]|uniref:Type VI secretion system protein ImpG n=1 Tax=Noviherbaspirillum denitrificans TaxID=1968433 RepID=A0A254T8T9_9BURK|nr:type VI secretion system baseplate subunit TssF [Noviherbaspirillum denitrificans]OWW19071.1 type VI secretion system protein ImpG [Noviherbaspirillum denitrificans]
MLEDLLPYYERELGYLRELSGEFARRYPKIARRLLLEGDQCEDPHVERIIEAFAFLTARIHRKLDDEFPEITEAFMQVLYPHYTRPFPSCTILQFEVDPGTPEIGTRYTVPRHHPAISPPVGGMPCRFRTCYDVDLYPLTLASASIRMASASDYLRRIAPDAAAAITLEFETQGALPLAQLKLDRLRFFLDGEPALMHVLYELLLTRAMRVRVDDGSDNPGRTTTLPAGALSAVGFEPEESLLDTDERTFAGFRLLSEYFAFPDKFLFVDLAGLDAPAVQHAGTRLRVQILLSSFPDSERHNRLSQTLAPHNFRMGCTPAINLFQHAAEPVRLTHHQATYPVLADGRRPLAYEVIAIDSVTSVEKNGTQSAFHDIPPFYSILHHARDEQQRAFWYATREASVREFDKGTDVELAFVDLDFAPQRPDAEVLSINLTCCNRDLPAQLPFGGSASGAHTDFSLPQVSVVKRARPLRKPTPTLRPPGKRGLQWRLVSHLSLNHLSIVEQGKEALQEMLALYNHTASQSPSRQIQGITAIRSQPAVTRVTGRHFSGFVRGMDVTLTIDEQAFVGAGAVLFGSVMERFLALYCGPNSFTRLSLRGAQQEQEIARWPARTGEALVI